MAGIERVIDSVVFENSDAIFSRGVRLLAWRAVHNYLGGAMSSDSDIASSVYFFAKLIDRDSDDVWDAVHALFDDMLKNRAEWGIK